MRAHPAALLELALLELDDDEFNSVQPEHAQNIQADQPMRTGIAWIDEAEKRLYGGLNDGTRD